MFSSSQQLNQQQVNNPIQYLPLQQQTSHKNQANLAHMQRQYDYVIKIVLVGSSGVGKSSILHRFADNNYNQYYISTIGIDFRFRSIPIDNYYVKLQIWDTAGQQRFQSITKSYYTLADIVIIVYDVNGTNTFDDLQNIWLKQAKNYCKNNAKIFVFCNKCDTHNLGIKPAHKRYLDNQGIQYYAVSAKTGYGVSDAILTISKKMIRKMQRIGQKNIYMELRQTHLQQKKDKKEKCC